MTTSDVLYTWHYFRRREHIGEPPYSNYFPFFYNVEYANRRKEFYIWKILLQIFFPSRIRYVFVTLSVGLPKPAIKHAVGTQI